jgi:3-methylfumaryl-CoA hydratase
VVIEERRDIVYREAAGPASTPVAQPEFAPALVPPGPRDWSIPVTPTLLFRFSALTYNAHRIHYDRDYARETEGYPALVTQGPLQVMAMAEAVRRRRGAIEVGETFHYRLVSPLYEHQSFIVGAEDTGTRIETSVRDESGRHTARGTVDPS